MKKSNFYNILPLAVFWAFACVPLLAQTNVNIAAYGVTGNNPLSIDPSSNCFYNFFDSGGPGLNYQNGSDASITFVPSDPATHRIQVTFSSFGLDAGWDALYIYNSATVGTNQIPGPQGSTLSGFPGGNWQTVSPGTITANNGIASVGNNPSGALTFRFRSDNSVSAAGWSAVVSQVPVINFSMTAPGAITAKTGPASQNSFANVTTPLPAINGGATAGLQLQYRINGGSPAVVDEPLNTTIPAPVGTNVITWQLVDPCGHGILAAALQTITVIDDTKPTINVPSDITLTLPSGASAINNYAYQVTCIDNCPPTKEAKVQMPIDFDNGQAGIMFDITNLSANPMTITEFGPSLSMGDWPLEVYYTTSFTSFQGLENNAGAWTLAGSQIIHSESPANSTPVPGYGITLQPGQTRGIYITSTIGAPIGYTEGTRQMNDGVLRISSLPGTGKAYPFGLNFSNRSYNGYVKYAVPTANAAQLVSGVPSGGTFALAGSPYTNMYQYTDAAGNTATASFKVTIQNALNTVTTLVCNDLVQFALDPDCDDYMNADQILEGGPYHNYDDYTVEVDKQPPFGNGPWVPAHFTAADIGKTYRVRITDNLPPFNKCFGDVKIVDNFPPVLDCSPIPITLPCNFDEDPLISSQATMQLRYSTPSLPGSLLLDNSTREFSLPVNLPMDAVVNDIELRVKISGDALYAKLRIQIESPAGVITNVWNGDQFSGCAPDPLFVRFDDEGTPLQTCPNYTTDKRTQSPLGGNVLSVFDGQPVNGNWKIRVTDFDGNNDKSKIELADLYITMTGKFGAGLPNNLSPNQITPSGFQKYTIPAQLIDCGITTLSYTDQNQTQDCTTGYTRIINRRWQATDASGNTATCIQQINFLRPTLIDVTLPPSYDGIHATTFECAPPNYPTPEWIELQGLQGWPYVFGQPDGCGTIHYEYEDKAVWTCDGAYNINREWSIIDHCTGEFKKETQIIRVVDKTGPVFQGSIPDQTITTDPYDCCTSMTLPDILVADACSRINNVSALVITHDPQTGAVTGYIPVPGGVYNFPGNLPNNPDTLAAFNQTPCIPVGDHIVIYTAEDACGNTTELYFNLHVVDFSPPVAACDETTVVAIGKDDPNDCYYPNPATCAFAGVTWVHATTFDDGSYDECSGIKFTIRRAEPYSECIKALDHSPCSKNANGISEYGLATAESDSIKFYCCEVGTELNVILRVYQMNADGTFSLDEDGEKIYNECVVKVQVQDKLKPVCDAPFNVTVNCENFDPSLWTYGKATITDNCCLDTSYHYQGQKGLWHSANYNAFDTVCNKGTITRTFRAFDCHGYSSQCTQRIIVNYEQDYFIKFPDDVIVTVCDGTGQYGAPQFYGEDCELLGVSYEDQIYTVVPDACYKIERTWKIINWCTYDPGGTCIVVPNPNPNATTNHITNLPGPIVSPQGTPAPWAPTVVKLSPGATTPTNFSVYWNQNANCYEYKQIIKIIDTQAPIMVCPPNNQLFCDLSTNNNQLWNESFWFDPRSQSHDLCEAPVDLNISATDFCSGANLNIRYLLFLDLDGEGTMETVISSTNLPAAGTVNFNNLNTPNFQGGTPRQFDERQVNANQKYRFTIQTTVNGTSMSAAVRWNTAASPGNYVVPELPYGTHKIKWIAGDGCGNESVCEYTFTVKDCKAPTVVCQNGLSGNLMQTGMLTLYASDFLLQANDNCTPEDDLVYAIRKCSNSGAQGFPVDAGGNPEISLTFGCNELGTQCVQLWAQDAYGNADYCESYIIVQDNAGNCNVGSATVAGLLKTEMSEGLEETDVELAGPTFNLFDMTDVDGHYNFSNAVPMHADYTLTPTKDDNPLNGVTTYDLVLISKHILGIEPFTTPYKMIAADANMSGSITTFDIVELRKLILGIYTELPLANSWRFVDKSFAFPNPANPFQTAFPETKTVADIQANSMEDNFVAVKVGDVNASAIANSLMSVDDRSSGTFLFDIDDRDVKAGEVFEVKVKAAEKVAGYQFTMNYNDLELVDVQPGPGMKSDNFATFPAENAITTSFNGAQQGSFTLKFKAKKAGTLSKMIGVSSRITKAEAYLVDEPTAQVNREDIALRFNSKDGSTIAGIGFELYQNQPNPFINHTVIGFHLPEAASATLSVFDESGRQVYSQKADFPKGYNSIPLEKGLLNTSGILYYRVETNTDSATKTMIQAK